MDDNGGVGKLHLEKVSLSTSTNALVKIQLSKKKKEKPRLHGSSMFPCQQLMFHLFKKNVHLREQWLLEAFELNN